MSDNLNAVPMAEVPRDAIANWGVSLEKSMERNRELIGDMARLAKEENFRFANLRLERVNHSFESVHDCKGISGLIGVQQEWMLDMMRDYAALGLRYAELFRPLAANAQTHVEATIDDIKAAVTKEADHLRKDEEEAFAAADHNAETTKDGLEQPYGNNAYQ